MSLNGLREKAAAAFTERGFPTTKEELWRFTDVSPLANTDFSNGWKSSELEFQPLGDVCIVFENGRLSREKSNFGNLPDGVHIGSIMDLADPRIGTLADTQSAFVAANTAYFSDGAFIEVEDGVELAGAIHLVYLADADHSAFHLRNFISVGKRASVAVLEEYVGQSNTVYWTNAVTEVFADDDTVVDHYKLQCEGEAAFHFQTIEAQLGTGTVFSNHSITLGSALGRNDIRGKLDGEEGEAICNGLYLLRNKQHFDTHLFMDHAAPKCKSHELYKGIMNDKARAVFCGRILVKQDSQQTDAIQSNRNLLLSRAAKVNSMPQLEIHADDVRCTHGATVGQLDEQALYYLQTRGIDPVRARNMLILAFANEVLDGVACKPVKTRAAQIVEKWLQGVSI